MKKVDTYEELSEKKLKWKCDEKVLGISTTDDLKMCPDIIGQKRALNALRLGFDIDSTGYNLFVTGLVGTGRKTAINCLLKETKRIKRIPDDKIYVNNFINQDLPRLIRLPAGKGKKFKKDMNEFIEYLIANIPAIFDSDNYQNSRKTILDSLKNKQKSIFKKFEKEINRKNFALIQMQIGTITRPAILPQIENKPVNFDQLAVMVKEGKMSETELETIEKTHAELSDKMEEVFKEMRNLEKKVTEELKSLNKQSITPLIDQRIKELNEDYDYQKVKEYLNEVRENIHDNLEKFKKPSEEKPALLAGLSKPPEDPFLEYQVNLLVDNYGATEAPVIFETSPSYANLFGTVEITPDRFGRSKTDFTKIKAGSILKADGGFLIVEALDLLLEPGVWPAFKRTLRNRKLEIQIYTPVYMISISAMKPEAIECDLKVAMIGDSFLYQLLYNQDEDFKKIFKLKAEFDSVMDTNNTTIMDYANFVKRIVNNENLSAFNSKAIAAVVEYGVKLAGTQGKLSTQFNNIADILREANYWAEKDNIKIVTDHHIEKAIEEKMERSRLIEEKIQEMIEEGTIMIATEGETIGQVNGLSVYDTGDYSFGKPARITANVSVGSSGIINIEREAQLSGRIHNKGVLILSGYLRQKYAQDKPLAISASICFEQSYSGIEGDSASSTEIYALLSALSQLPLKQTIAVTGSVNQKGEIQPIGGVNQKIEGFFKVCQAQGLNGSQGVMIPHQNIKDLMLANEVIKAVKEGKFHIYPVKTIDQGIEILTSVKSGSISENGRYEEGTVNFIVDMKLREYADIWKRFRFEDNNSG